MARPSYVLVKNTDVLVVQSKDVMKLTTDGYQSIRIATTEDLNQTPSFESLFPESENTVIEVGFKEKLEHSKSEEILVEKTTIETPKAKTINKKSPIKKTTAKKSLSENLPNDLICPECNVKAKNQTVYSNSHGKNCFRAKRIKP